MSWRVVVTDHVFPSIDPVRGELAGAGAELAVAAPGREGLLSAVQDADGVLTTYAPIDAALIDQMRRCRVIARFGAGVDNVNVEAATRRGMWVTNVPDYCVDEVSDHTLALILALVRRVVFLNSVTNDGEWAYERALPIQRLRGLVLGLVGFGQIGRMVCEKSRPFGFRTVVHDPYVPPPAMEAAGVAPVDFDTLLHESDVISIHVPLTGQTRRLFDHFALGRMKQGSFLVNTSRGGIVDEAALRRALDGGRIAGAALDVLEHEGPAWESPLRGHPRVILTPHVAFYSEESVRELQRKAVRQVAMVLAGLSPDYPVNRPAGGGESGGQSAASP